MTSERRRVFATAAALLLGVAACEGDGRVDPGLPNLDELAFLDAVEELRIGSRDDPVDGFSDIASVDVDAQGRVFAFDAQDVQVRVYGEDGREIRRIGRQGDGPGEFQREGVLGVRGDTLWVLESGVSTRQISLFTTDGEYLSRSRAFGVPTPMFGRQLAMVVPEFMGEDGYFSGYMRGVSMLRSTDPPSDVAPNDTIHLPVVRFDLQGTVIDTVGTEVRAPAGDWLSAAVFVDGERYLPIFPSDDPARVRLHDGQIWVERPVAETSSGGTVVVTRVRFDGDTVYTRAFAYEPVAFNDTILDEIAVGASLRLINPEGTGYFPLEEAGPESIRVRAGIRAALDVPDFQPPVQGEWMANDGSLWLRRENQGGDTVRWVVFDRGAVPIGQVRLPRDLWLGWSRDGVLWAVDPDEYDVPWLVRYRVGP